MVSPPTPLRKKSVGCSYGPLWSSGADFRPWTLFFYTYDGFGTIKKNHCYMIGQIEKFRTFFKMRIYEDGDLMMVLRGVCECFGVPFFGE